jgi:hypothetical protein
LWPSFETRASFDKLRSALLRTRLMDDVDMIVPWKRCTNGHNAALVPAIQPCPVSKKYQRPSRVLALLFIVLFVEPDAIDHQLSRVFFLNIDDGHRGAAGSAANSITDLDIVFIRHRFLQCSPMGEGVLLAGCPMYSVSSHGER